MTVVEWQISHTLPSMILALLESPAPRTHARVYTEGAFELQDRQLEEVLSGLPAEQPPIVSETDEPVSEESSLCFL